MNPIDIDDEEEVAKEMHDARFPRVDVVSGPASGMRFVILKAGEQQDDAESVWKVKYDAQTQRDMLAKGQAFKGPDGEPSYPIADKADLEVAFRAVGRGKENHDAIRKYIMRRAKALGATSDIPDNWAADGSLKEAAVQKTKRTGKDADELRIVTKAADDEELPDADELMSEAQAGAAGSEVPTEAPGDPDEPTSAAWEAVDAARARQSVNMVIALQRLVQVALTRESQEVVTGDGDDDDAENAFDLQGVLDCLDCVLDTLAPFAVDEQAESEDRVDDAEQVVTKSGRVLSSANENSIRQAQQLLQQVLASLPAATVGDAAVEDEPVAKAKGDPMVACYNENGQLIGVVDPDNLQAIAAGTPVDDSADAKDDSADDTSDDAEAPAADAPAAAPDASAAPAPAAPAADDQAVAKNMTSSEEIAELIQSTVKKALEMQAEEHETVLKGLRERLEVVERSPATGGPLLNGRASGAGDMPLRGQDGGDGQPITTPEIEAVRKQLATVSNPADVERLNHKLVFEILRARANVTRIPPMPAVEPTSPTP